MKFLGRLFFLAVIACLVLHAKLGAHAFAPPSSKILPKSYRSIPSTITSLWSEAQGSPSTTSSVTSTTTNRGEDDNKKLFQPQSFQPPSRPASHYDALVCGGGPTGLLTALMLAQHYGPDYKIGVCEQRPTLPPSPSDNDVWSDVARFYLLGMGHRGQSALKKFGVFEDFVQASVEVQGRRNWEPGMTREEDGKVTIANKDPPSRVLARDKLVGVLHEHLVEKYILTGKANIDLLYGYQVEPLDFFDKENQVEVRITKCQDTAVAATENNNSYQASQEAQQECNVEDAVEATTSLLIGADGAARTVAQAMQTVDQERYQKLNPLQKLIAKQPFRITKFNDDNPRVYKSVPIKLPQDWPWALNYSARSRNSRITLEGLPSDDQGNLCALLLMRPDDELAQANVEPTKLRQFFNEEFPQFGKLIDDEEIARVAQKPASPLPRFRYAGPRLHLGPSTLVLGDAAHTVKPYYGLGANTALEDVAVLADILQETSSVNDAVQTFSKRKAGDAAALVTISRNMDRPGKLFFLTFLAPLILDGIFHKLAPKIFGPNMFGMFQKKGMGFKQIQRKKRLDRALQLVCIGTVLTGMGLAVKATIRGIAKTIKQPQPVVTAAMLSMALVAATIQKRIKANQKPTPSESAT